MKPNTFGIYKKLTLTFLSTANVDILPVLAVPPHKYAGSRKEGTHLLRYYRAGFQLMRSDEFALEYGKQTSYRPTTTFVILLSMNRSTMPDGKRVIKIRNKVSLILPVDISSVRDGDNVYMNPGLSVDPKIFDYVMLSINIYTGAGDLHVQVAEVKDYIETTSDTVKAVQRAITPMLETASTALSESAVEVWQSPEGETMMLDYVMAMLTKIGLMNPLAEASREKLVQRLMVGETGVVEDGVRWDSEGDRLSDIRDAGGDVDRAKENRRNMLRMRHLMDDLTLEQRLKELTRAEVENTVDLTRPNITMAMTDDEIDKWYASESTDATAELELIVLTRYLSKRRN